MADGSGATSLEVAFDHLPTDRYSHTIELRPAPGELVSDEQFDYDSNGSWTASQNTDEAERT